MILVPLCFLCFVALSGVVHSDPLSYYCPSDGTTFSPNSTFRSNLDSLLSTLSSNSNRNNGFFSSTAGQSTPDVVHGHFLCRGDVTTDQCRSCVSDALREIRQLCPNRTLAIAWYDNCLLQYSVQSFPGIRVSMLNTQNVTDDPNRFGVVLGELLDDVSNRAANDQFPGRKFAVGGKNITSLQRLYALAQCTPDLSSSDCYTCLRDGITSLGSCCSRSRGARTLFPQCNIRFEMYPFYNQTGTKDGSQGKFSGVASNCSTDSNSISVRNRNELLGRLTLSSSNNSVNGFYRTDVGSSNDIVYGLFLCRGDTTIDDCKLCVSTATIEITQLCPEQAQAMVWYDKCMLRYSNQANFGDVGLNINSQINRALFDPKMFTRLLGNLINVTVDQAARNTFVNKFATGNASEPSFPPMYGLAQCIPDMTNSDCSICLRKALASLRTCCADGFGGRGMLPSCVLRYETYPFFDAPRSPSTIRQIDDQGNQEKRGIATGVVVSIAVLVGVMVSLSIMAFYLLKRKTGERFNDINDYTDENEMGDVESLQYDLRIIQVATNNFSDENKLGEGGFGKVYKGILPDGQEIAVKRLSRSSGQGAIEFKNEVMVVAKLQHRNLVRLIGYCLRGKERILIYEYVPNKSLDYFLFDPSQRELLNWSTRFKIIGGIARAILYLHEDSRHKVIHRDLKVSNILLDANLNPKISDFGMARIVGVDESQINTHRIVGTYGYMAPEYAMFGQFSPKSDMYSFGILILEIVSGKKNSNFYHSENCDSLPAHAFRYWRDDNPLRLMDPMMGDSYDSNEVIKCIHIGLLCVQEEIEDRPTMAMVLQMLSNNSVVLPVPHQPAFFVRNRSDIGMIGAPSSNASTSKSSALFSVNEASMTEPYPR